MTLKGVATILNRLLAAGLVLGAIALSGCNAGNDTLLPEPECPAPVEPGEPVKGFLSLLIDTGSRPGSRADNANGWGDEYDPENGNDFENRIDPRKIYIAVYRRDGTLLGTVNSASGTPGVSLHQFTDNPTLYQVVFDVSAMDVFTGGDYTAACFRQRHARRVRQQPRRRHVHGRRPHERPADVRFHQLAHGNVRVRPHYAHPYGLPVDRHGRDAALGS